MKVLLCLLLLLAPMIVLADYGFPSAAKVMDRDIVELQRKAQTEERLSRIEDQRKTDDAIREQVAIHRQSEDTIRKMNDDMHQRVQEQRMQDIEQRQKQHDPYD